MNFHQKLVHAVTLYDEKQSKKPGYNRYALPQYLEAINNVERDIENGGDPRKAIVAAFSGRLANAVLKAAGESGYTKEDATSGGLFYKPVSRNPRRAMLAAHARAVRSSRAGQLRSRARKSVGLIGQQTIAGMARAQGKTVAQLRSQLRNMTHGNRALMQVHRKLGSRDKPPKRNPRSVDCVVLKGATTGKVYARLLNSTTTMADMKAMARVIAARYKEAVTATRVRVTP